MHSCCSDHVFTPSSWPWRTTRSTDGTGNMLVLNSGMYILIWVYSNVALDLLCKVQKLHCRLLLATFVMLASKEGLRAFCDKAQCRGGMLVLKACHGKAIRLYQCRHAVLATAQMSSVAVWLCQWLCYNKLSTPHHGKVHSCLLKMFSSWQSFFSWQKASL